jgi:hypothetical protein
MPIWSRRSLLPARTKARLRLSGDHTTWSERSRPAWPASSMMTLVLVARSSSQVRPFLSVCASHLPSGDGYSCRAVAGAVRGQALAVAGAVGRVAPDLVLAAGVDDRIDPFVVVAEDGAARTGAFRHRDLDAALAAGAGNRHASARGQHDALEPCWRPRCRSGCRAATSRGACAAGRSRTPGWRSTACPGRWRCRTRAGRRRAGRRCGRRPARRCARPIPCDG